MGELVLRRLEAGVGIVSLNRPEKHNAMNNALGAEFREAWDWAVRDSEVRCILLRGEGPSFCSGRDLGQLGQRERDDSNFGFVRRAQDGRLAQLDVAKPIVAALRGHAIGGGFEMALGADMRIAARDLWVSLPEVQMGILPDTGGTQLLTTLIGPAKTKYMVMTGDRVGAEQALEWGIVDWLVEPEELDERAFELAAKLAAGPPLAIAMAKQLVDQLWAGRVRDGIRQELLAQTALFSSEDYAEARSARSEGREPRYRGR